MAAASQASKGFSTRQGGDSGFCKRKKGKRAAIVYYYSRRGRKGRRRSEARHAWQSLFLTRSSTFCLLFSLPASFLVTEKPYNKRAKVSVGEGQGERRRGHRSQAAQMGFTAAVSSSFSSPTTRAVKPLLAMLPVSLLPRSFLLPSCVYLFFFFGKTIQADFLAKKETRMRQEKSLVLLQKEGKRTKEKAKKKQSNETSGFWLQFFFPGASQPP